MLFRSSASATPMLNEQQQPSNLPLSQQYPNENKTQFTIPSSTTNIQSTPSTQSNKPFSQVQLGQNPMNTPITNFKQQPNGFSLNSQINPFQYNPTVPNQQNQPNQQGMFNSLTTYGQGPNATQPIVFGAPSQAQKNFKQNQINNLFSGKKGSVL